MAQRQRGDEARTAGSPAIAVQPATPPPSMEPAEQQRILRETEEVILRLRSATEADELELADQVANVGEKAQRSVASELSLMQTNIGALIGDEHKTALTSEITGGIQDLQKALAKINPSAIQNELAIKLIGWIPIVGNSAVRVLETAAMRRETVRDFVQKIEVSLQKGRGTLASDNAQLVVLYRNLEQYRDIIRKNVYFAELLAERIEQEAGQTQDSAKQQRLRNVLFRVSTRIQDLLAMEEVYAQFFASITITRDNNSLLIGTIDRMLTLGMNVVTVAFAIAAALSHQRDVLDAARSTQEFTGRLIAANAAAIRRHVGEIGDIYKQPIVAMEKLEAAHRDLVEAIGELDRLKTQGIQTAKEHSARLRQMTQELYKKSSGGQAVETASLEAVELPRRQPGSSERPAI